MFRNENRSGINCPYRKFLCDFDRLDVIGFHYTVTEN